MIPMTEALLIVFINDKGASENVEYIEVTVDLSHVSDNNELDEDTEYGKDDSDISGGSGGDDNNGDCLLCQQP
jgi:hypothetical protein